VLKTYAVGGVVMICVTLIAKAGGGLIASYFGTGDIAPTAIIFFCMLAAAGWALGRFWPDTVSQDGR
jgi:hypothetical protein